MNLIMVSIDNSIFIEWSDTRKRLLEYSKMLDKLLVIVYSKKWFIDFKIGENIFVYPTNSLTKIHFIYDAYRIWEKTSRDLNKNVTVITTQDPFETWIVWYLLKIKFWFWLNIQIHTDPFSIYFRRESILNYLRFFIAKILVLPSANSIRTVSKSVQKKLNQLYVNIATINIPIFQETFIYRKQITPHKEFRILSISRLEKVKNIKWIIDVVSDLSKENKNIQLTIVWRGNEENNLKKYVELNNCSNQVIFKPWTYEIEKEYSQHDLFILNSFYEWWWRTVIEAANYGLPIIMTNTGCAWDFLINKKNWYVIDIWNSEQLKKSIMNLYKNIKLRNKFIEDWFQRLEKLPNKKTTLELYYSSWKLALQKIKIKE